jgi:hypothetical protein
MPALSGVEGSRDFSTRLRLALHRTPIGENDTPECFLQSTLNLKNLYFQIICKYNVILDFVKANLFLIRIQRFENVYHTSN